MELTFRNGALSDATVRVYAGGTSTEIAAGRTYMGAKTNPKVFRVTAGDYDVEVKAIEISGSPTHRFEGVSIEGGGRAERSYDFASGTLRLGAVQGGELVDVTLGVKSAESERVYGRR